MKKLLAVVLAVAMLLSMVSLAGAEEVQEITWMFWDDLEASSDLITQGFKQVIDRFNEDYAGKYHVTPITTQLEPYYTDLNALVDAQKTPDVFIVSPGPNLTDYVAPGIAAPLDEYLADGWKDTFAGDAVFAQQTYDGKIYAIPLNTAAACVFYNKEIFTYIFISMDKGEYFKGHFETCISISSKSMSKIIKCFRSVQLVTEDFFIINPQILCY